MIYSRFTIAAQPSIASQIFLICETKVFDQHEEYLKETTNSEWQHTTVSDSTSQWLTAHHSEWQPITVSDSTKQWVTHHSKWQDMTVSDSTPQWVTGQHSEWQHTTVSDRTSQWVTGQHSEWQHTIVRECIDVFADLNYHGSNIR